MRIDDQRQQWLAVSWIFKVHAIKLGILGNDPSIMKPSLNKTI